MQTARHDLPPLIDPSEEAFPGIRFSPPFVGWNRWQWVNSEHPEAFQAHCEVDATTGQVQHIFGHRGITTHPGVDLRGVAQCGFRYRFRGDSTSIHHFRAHWSVEKAQIQVFPGSTVRLAAGLRLGSNGTRLGDFETVQGPREVALSFSVRPATDLPEDLFAFLQIYVDNPSTGVLTAPAFGQMTAVLRHVSIQSQPSAEAEETEGPIFVGRGTPAVDGETGEDAEDGGTVVLDEPVALSELLTR